MKQGWLALLLIMPGISGAEGVVDPAVPAAVVSTEATAVDDRTPVAPPVSADTVSENKPRPTLVEKLKAQEAAAPRSHTPAWGDMIVGLMAVLGLILAMAWLTKRLKVRVPGLAGKINIVESAALGPRERLCIVEVDGKRLLLGVTQQSITLLQSGECESRKDDADSMFSEKIKKMLQNGTPNDR